MPIAKPDAFKLIAQIVEIKEKPSKPIGILGKDALGNTPKFPDHGLRRRAILGIGKQDVSFEKLAPIDPNFKIIGGSSDYIVVDVTETENYQVGDTIEFAISYLSLLQLMTSPYVYKAIN